MNNIERFDEVVGELLGLLYSAFPIPVHLDVSELAKSHPKPEVELETVGGAGVLNLPELNAEETFIHHCIDWLMHSGFIRAKAGGEGWFANAVLTTKGLQVLKAYPSSLSEGPTIGEQLASASKSGATDLLRSAASEAIALSVNVMAKALGVST